MIYGVTYSSGNMDKSAQLCAESMERHGVDDVRVLSPSWWRHWKGEDTFDWLNRDILKSERGHGFWLWKSWAISYRMNDIKDGDYLVYSDAGVEFIAPINHIIDRMDQDIFFFTNGFPHVEWCKWDVISAINSPAWHKTHLGDGWFISDKWIRDFKQVQASVIFIKVNRSTRNFIKEWLLYCQMPGFIDDSPSKLPNYPTFAEHRHDQAILSCLQIKYGYEVHFWPTIYSEHIRHTAQPGDNYPVMFNHHRRRDPGCGNGEPEWPNS